jgi:exportin-1
VTALVAALWLRGYVGGAAHSASRQAILDFSIDLDVNLLDQVVQAFYGGSGAEQQRAQQALTQFQDHPESWQRVPAVLEQARNTQTKVRPRPARLDICRRSWPLTPFIRRVHSMWPFRYSKN